MRETLIGTLFKAVAVVFCLSVPLAVWTVAGDLAEDWNETYLASK
jgi:hypothetical protein